MADDKLSEPYGSVDNLRKEHDPKIDSKVSYQVFFGILGILALIILAVFNNIFTQISTLNTRIDTKTDAQQEKIDGISQRTTVVETKLGMHKNQ